jgi:hypothetical protein
MRKAILMMLLAGVSGSAVADWVKVADVTNMRAYADSATIRKTGNTIQMWTLYDYTKAQFDGNNKSYLSSKGQSEYDCNKVRKRPISVSAHSEKMAEGEVVAIGSIPGQWEPVLPRSLGEALWNFACGKW